MQLRTPVVLIIHKRPHTTERVFQAIRQAQPQRLLVIADGPRSDRAGEVEKCSDARAILNRIDWNCEVLRNYSEINLGCQQRIVSGLNWVFSIVEEAIILEDDCLPDPSFFQYCQDLLEHYRYDQRIFSISGQNVQKNWNRTPYSYYFSHYHLGWGWATWRRTWEQFDVKIPFWPLIRDQGYLNDVLGNSHAVRIWSSIFESLYKQPANTIWDYQMMLTCWSQGGLTILPRVKLVENIGFGAEGTHTLGEDDPYCKIPLGKVSFPLKHPPFIIRDVQTDDLTQNSWFDYQPSLFKRFIKKAEKFKNIFNY